MTRADRRRAAKEARKASQTLVGTETPAPTVSLWPLLWALSALLFVCFVIAFVQGWSLWNDPLIAALGWTGVGAMGLYGFYKWHTARHLFRKARIRLMQPFVMVAAPLLGSMFYVGGLEYLSHARELDTLIGTHKQHAQQLQAWDGKRLSVVECQQGAALQTSMMARAQKATHAPSLRGVNDLLAHESHLYQGGCANRYKELYAFALGMPKKWGQDMARRRATEAFNVGWPTAMEGCAQTQVRHKNLSLPIPSCTGIKYTDNAWLPSTTIPEKQSKG